MAEEGMPIDRGWAWVCLAGSHLCFFFVIGMYKSLGILFEEFLEIFHGSSSVTAIFMGVVGGGFGLMGPVASVLGVKFTNRRICMIGGVLFVIVHILTMFANSITYVICIYGCFLGIGIALTWSPTMANIGQYFDKRRSLANGVSLAGGSLGQLTLPHLLRYLLDEYSYKGALLLFGGIMGNVIVAGSLYRPLSFYQRKNRENITKSNSDEHQLPPDINIIQSEGSIKNGFPSENLDGKGDTYAKNSLKKHTAKMDGFHHSTPNCSASEHKHGIKREVKPDTDLHTHNRSLSVGDVRERRKLEDTKKSMGSMYFLPFQDNSHLTDTKKLDISSSDDHSKCSKFCTAFVRIFDWDLFRNYTFITFIAAIVAAQVGYIGTQHFLPAHVTFLGMSKHTAAVLISIIGATDIPGRIGGGWLADFGFIRKSTMLALSLIITGVTEIICLLVSDSFPSLVVLAVAVGILGGTYVALFPSTLVDYFGLERLPNTLGLTVMSIGLTNTPMYFLYGSMRDWTGSYDATLYLCASLMILGGALFYTLPFVDKLQKRKERRFQQPVSDGDI